MRKKNIKVGLYYSLYEWYHPLWQSDKKRFVAEHMFPQFKDLVTRYHPEIIWADGEWEMSWETWRSPELLAWLFNNAPNEKDLVINDRWGKGIRHKHGGFYTTEYGSGMDDDSHPWEENRGMGFSYGYNRAEDAGDYRTAQELILMQERLLKIGAWLKANGQAIYGTRMWKVPCQWSAGIIPKTERKEYMSKFNILEQTIAPPQGQAFKEVLFTFKNGNLYAITPSWPGRKLILKNVKANRDTEITFLGTGEKLLWEVDNNNLAITTPEFDTSRIKNQYAYVFRISNIEP